MSEQNRASEATESLLDRLDLEQIDLNIYRGQNEKDRPGRLFGGQVAAQSLVAAGRTVEGVPAHSLHGYFLRPGDPNVPVVYSVDRIRDGRSFTTRRVVAQQHGKAIFNMAVSFHEPEDGFSHQIAMPEVPGPEALPTMAEHFETLKIELPAAFEHFKKRRSPIETRYQYPPTFMGGPAHEGPCFIWLRAASPLPDDPFLHQCVLSYATDMSLIDCIVRPHARPDGRGPMMVASLDHAVWFHKPMRCDEWLLYYQDSPAAFGARGLARGSLFTQQGELVASVAQEALVRPSTAPEDRTL